MRPFVSSIDQNTNLIIWNTREAVGPVNLLVTGTDEQHTISDYRVWSVPSTRDMDLYTGSKSLLFPLRNKLVVFGAYNEKSFFFWFIFHFSPLQSSHVRWTRPFDR